MKILSRVIQKYLHNSHAFPDTCTSVDSDSDPFPAPTFKRLLSEHAPELSAEASSSKPILNALCAPNTQ